MTRTGTSGPSWTSSCRAGRSTSTGSTVWPATPACPTSSACWPTPCRDPVATITRSLWHMGMMINVLPDAPAELLLRSGEGLPARIEALDAFTDGWLRNRRLSEHTREAYRRDVGTWLHWCWER